MVQSVSSELVADARLLPAPHTAVEKAAIEAALLATPAPRRAMKLRILLGTAALAVAVTVPNLSLGAMGSPFFRLAENSMPRAQKPTMGRTPPARVAPSYVPQPFIPVSQPDDITSTAVTYGTRSGFNGFRREVPLGLLVDARPLDLASAPVDMPVVATASFAAALREQPVSLLRGADRLAGTNLVFMEQITERPLVARLAPARARALQVIVSPDTSAGPGEIISDAALVSPVAVSLDTPFSGEEPTMPPAPQRETILQVGREQMRPARVSVIQAGQGALTIDTSLGDLPVSPIATPAFPTVNPVTAASASAPARSRPGLAAQIRTARITPAPVAVIAEASDAFSLAAEPFEAVALAAIAPSARLPQAPLQKIGAATPARNAHLVDIEQISGRPLIARAAPEEAREVRGTLGPQSSVMRSDAISNELVESAFAGVIGASRDIRGSLPLNRSPRPESPNRLPEAVRAAIVRTAPIPQPDPGLGAAAAEQASLVPKSELDARINGVLTGTVDFRQLDGTIAVRLRSVVGLLRDRFSSTEFSALLEGDAIDTFVPIAQLQAVGVPISYNPAYDEVEFGIDYQDAPNAKKVQVEQIGAPSIGQERTMIEQIPRRR
jgi:hypothetical protein